MELRHLKYFKIVAEELNFTKAAKRLNISQPPLSKQIKQLEEEIGARLFLRTNKKVELTDSGKFFLERVNKIIQEIEEASNQAKKTHEEESRNLTIGVTNSALYSFIPILRAYQEKFHLVNVKVHQLSTPEQIRALNKKQINIGFVCAPITKKNLRTMSINKQRFIIALPETHYLANKNPISIKDLKENTFITTPRQEGPVYYDTVMNIFKKAGYTPKISSTAHTFTSVMSLVSANMGIAILPSSMKNNPVTGVVYKELKEFTPKKETAIVWEQDTKSQIINGFINLAKEYI